MTEAQYYDKLLKYYYNFGKLGKKVNTSLKLGVWCQANEDLLVELGVLLDYYSLFDLRDLEEFGVYTCYKSEEEFFELVNYLDKHLS
jgi:hypothetical protein